MHRMRLRISRAVKATSPRSLSYRRTTLSGELLYYHYILIYNCQCDLSLLGIHTILLRLIKVYGLKLHYMEFFYVLPSASIAHTHLQTHLSWRDTCERTQVKSHTNVNTAICVLHSQTLWNPTNSYTMVSEIINFLQIKYTFVPWNRQRIDKES